MMWLSLWHNALPSCRQFTLAILATTRDLLLLAKKTFSRLVNVCDIFLRQFHRGIRSQTVKLYFGNGQCQTLAVTGCSQPFQKDELYSMSIFEAKCYRLSAHGPLRQLMRLFIPLTRSIAFMLSIYAATSDNASDFLLPAEKVLS
jgi:hypothetical protein